MIFRTRGLKASSLLAIPFYCFVLIALLHPDTGHCGKKRGKQEENSPLLENQDNDEEKVEPPPPYSPEADLSAEAFTGGHLNIGDVCYSVRDTKKVEPVSMQGLGKGKLYLDISYNNLVPECYQPGDYITTPVEFSIVDHHLEELAQFTGFLWLFPNGIGSGATRGKVFVTIQNLRGKEIPNKSSTPETEDLSSALLKATESDNSSFRLSVTLQHSEIRKSESFYLPLFKCEQTLIDLGRSSRLGEFKDQFAQNTIQLSWTPCEQIRRDDSVAPGDGHSFVYEVPYASLLLERHEDGTPTPQAKASVGVGCCWIEVDGQFIAISLRNRTTHITTSIYCPGKYEQIVRIQDHYLEHAAETPRSSAQQQAFEERVLQDSKERFHSFMLKRNLTIYWMAPNGKKHVVGRFGNAYHRRWEKGNHFITRPWPSSITYKQLLAELDGQTATFRLEVSAPVHAQDQASHPGKYPKCPSGGSGKGSVQPVPPLAAQLKQLQINGRKMGTSAGKNQ